MRVLPVLRALPILLTLTVLPLLPIGAAASSSALCTAHARQIAADFDRIAEASGTHPLDLGADGFRMLLTGYMQDGTRDEKDLARQVVLTMQLSLQDGCNDLGPTLARLR